MVKNKSTTKTTRRRATPRAAPKRRRSTSGTKYIPSAMATVGLVMANADLIKSDITSLTARGVTDYARAAMRNKRYMAYLKPDRLVKDALGLAGGYVAGEVAKKYAPGVIKRPLGKISKKIPKVI